MSKVYWLAKSLSIEGENAEGGTTEIHLTTDNEIRFYAEDDEGHTFTYTLEQAEEIMAGLGRLIWLAKHAGTTGAND